MRADLYLSQNGYVQSRQRARTLIEGGYVEIDGAVVPKPAFEVGEGDHVVTVQDPLRYVGRGGWKLEGALDAFGLDVTGLSCLDVGASTGGFTDCLLQRGAARVCAVDAGSGQLAAKLREDPRVRSMERTNARELTAEALADGRVDLVVMDVSFISATYLLPRFPLWMRERAHGICLIKPQFEVGRSMLGKGGIVKDPKAHLMAVERVLEAIRGAGMIPVGLIPSPIEGGDGNREFLVHFVTEACGGDTLTEAQVKATCRS